MNRIAAKLFRSWANSEANYEYLLRSTYISEKENHHEYHQSQRD